MRLRFLAAGYLGCSAVLACGGSGFNSAGPSDSGASTDATDETIIVNSDATTPAEASTSDSGTSDSSTSGGDTGTVVDSSAGETSVSCEAGTVDCNGVCVNESNDPNHCGSCSKVCAGPDAGMGVAICSSSTCALGCESDSGTSLLCGTQCVDPVNVEHCGTCTNVCPAPTANGTAECASGSLGPSCTFACTAGYHACGATCLSNTDDPSSDPCVVADGLGVFVSPTGSDSTGNGTKEAPFATIGHGMGVAAGGTKRVYACGTFTTGVTVTAADDGVTVYGGLSCSSWAYSATTPTQVTPSAAGYALQIIGTDTNGVVFEDFAFTAQSAPSTPPTNTPAASSIAVFVSGAIATFTRVTATAGIGQPGAGGAGATNWTGMAPGAGAPGVVSGGAGGIPNKCDDQTSSTGGTGATFASAVPAQPGVAQPTVGVPNAGLTGGTTCTGATAAANGPASSSAATGATVSGTLGASGWTPSAGANGANGGPAQGGGGGGADDDATSGGPGGGGGSGGCGGGAGLAGGSGGSSIAIAAFQSSLLISGATILAGAAGSGGAGGAGQMGQAGGAATSGHGGGCAGSPGGVGGGGGGGGGGAGGLSAGIAWIGSSGPTINGTVVTSQASGVTGITVVTGAMAGGVGAGGSAPSGNPGPNGQPGATGQSGDVINL